MVALPHLHGALHYLAAEDVSVEQLRLGEIADGQREPVEPLEVEGPMDSGVGSWHGYASSGGVPPSSTLARHSRQG